MKDDAGASGYDLERLFQAVQDDSKTYGDDLRELAREWRKAVSDVQRLNDDVGAKVIEAVRELLSFSWIPGESAHQEDATESGEQKTQPAVMDLIQSPNGMTQYQSLAMIAGLVRWASRETGRSEAEVLEEIAALCRH